MSLTQKDYEKYKKLLTDKREELLSKAKNILSEDGLALDRDNIFDEMDMGSSESEQALKLRLMDKDYKLLREIGNALKKFDDGSYGICEGTGNYINKKRLDIRPWTKYSIEYKEELEKEKKRRK